MSNLSIRRDDTVVVLSGKDKGKKGKVLKAFPKSNTVVVEGVNLATLHKKPKGQRDPGGIIHKEIPIFAPKVMRICPKCNEPTRVAHFIAGDGTKTRRCKKCNESI